MADNALVPAEEKSSSRLELKQIINPSVLRQFLALVGVAAAVALGMAIVMWTRSPNYGLLYTGLEDKDAEAVVQALQTANEPYKLGPDGSSILVPQSDLADIKLKLAGQGLPQGKVATPEGTGTDSPFGMSDLAERTHFQQALETDLGSTITALKSVRAARVHLALPKSSAFVHDNHDASASVLVQLYPGRSLDPSQVQAIVHLVSSSVPGLEAKDVSVVDQDGQLLTNDDPANSGNDADNHLRLTTRVENAYAQRIEALLTPLVGEGKVHAQVAADLDFSDNERAIESYGKDPVLRSEQTSNQQSTGAAGSSGQVAGALSNEPPNTVAQPTAAAPAQGKTVVSGRTPPTSTAAAAAQGPASASSTATRNYELDHTITHVEDPAGRISRLTVAVAIDNQSVTTNGVTKSVPFTTSELDHFTTLAKNAVGFDDQRGDKLSVINEPFQAPVQPSALPPVPFWEKPDVLNLIKYGIMMLVLLGIVLGAVRPLTRSVLRATATRPILPGRNDDFDMRAPLQANVRGFSNDPMDDIVRLSEPTDPAAIYERKLERAKSLATQDPKQVAQIVKNWVVEHAE